MSRLLSSVLLAGTLLAPLSLLAQDHDHDHDQRYYDSAHKDYHQWNANEDRSYHDWLKEKHAKDHDWSKASKKEQQQYWAWRHDHPDAH